MNKRTLYRSFLAVMFVAIVLVAYSMGRFREISEFAHVPEWVSLIVFLIGSGVFIVTLGLVIFSGMLSRVTDKLSTLRNAEPADFTLLDTQTFDHYDAQLTGLGFEPRFYFIVESAPKSKGLARLYYHPVHRCLATNGQLFQGNARTAVAFVMSKLDDEWSLSTSNVKTNPVQYLWRRPRALWNAVPGGEPREMLDAHLNIRQRMIDGLGVDNATPDIEQHAYFERQTENNRQNLEQLRRRNVIILYLEYNLCCIRPIFSWMGDLEKAVRDRRES